MHIIFFINTNFRINNFTNKLPTLVAFNFLNLLLKKWRHQNLLPHSYFIRIITNFRRHHLRIWWFLRFLTIILNLPGFPTNFLKILFLNIIIFWIPSKFHTKVFFLQILRRITMNRLTHLSFQRLIAIWFLDLIITNILSRLSVLGILNQLCLKWN